VGQQGDIMPELNIQCPKCKHQFPLSEVMTTQIEEHLQKEFDEKLQAELTKAREDAVKKAIETEKQERETLQSRLEAQEKSLQEARENEKKLRAERAQLEEEKKEIELTVQRKLDEERKELEEKLLKKSSDEFFMKLKEKDKQIGDLNKLVDEMKRKGQQGSMERQGEVFEDNLLDVLSLQFKDDDIQPVPKGEMGADVIQTVYNSNRQQSGVIIWEAKNTQNWSEKWVDKLKKDQREAGADVAVLISKALPKDFDNFGQYNGIWLTCHASAIGLAAALRHQLIEVNFAHQASEGKQDKMELLYQYLSGPAFKQKVNTIVETFTDMHTQLQKEKNAMKAIWNEREKQIQQVIDSTAGMYGEMRAIIGRTLPQIESLELGPGEENEE
jgi:hypothetical protein